MTDYISRDDVKKALAEKCRECEDACEEFDGIMPDCTQCLMYGAGKSIMFIPAADARPVVMCRDCKHNNACLTQAFVEEESKVPFDRNTFFCADGERGSYA